MRTLARVAAITILGAGCGAGDGAAPPDASALDATADAPPGPPATVRLIPEVVLAPRGTSVTVAWAATGASSCAVTTSRGGSGSGTSGSVSVTVDGVVRVVASCQPGGPAAVAAITVAPQCTGELVADTLRLEDVIKDGNGVALEVPADACLVAREFVSVFDGTTPEIAARLRSVGGRLFFQKAGINGLDFVALERVGQLALDYQNGHYPPGIDGVDDTYLSFPSLTTVTTLGQPIMLASGRVDLPALEDAGLTLSTFGGHDGVEVVELRDGATLTSVSMFNTQSTAPPQLVGQPAGVTGDVTIQQNLRLPHAEAQRLVDALGAIGGAVTVCGNLDDAACPPPP